ncbi:hypothetical protein GAMM_30029 [Gammaproteobacteria bacterium]
MRFILAFSGAVFVVSVKLGISFFVNFVFAIFTASISFFIPIISIMFVTFVVSIFMVLLH